jgi:dihydroflavonol-4-reductase
MPVTHTSRVAITGASGLLGGNLAAELIAAGHQVVATKRAGSVVKHLADLPIEWRDAELGSIEALTKAFTGVECVFHCAAAVTVKREVTPEMTAANVTGTDNVIDACIAAKVPRLVHTSSVVAIGLSTNGRPCDETATWNFDKEGLDDAYAITKHRAEERVNAAKDRIDAVIVNPTYMFGPRDAKPSSGGMILDVVKGKVPGYTNGYNNFVDVRDVARGMIAAWQKGRRGERYILAGYDMTYRDVFAEIARVAGVKPPRFRVPKFAAKLLGKWGDFVERRGEGATSMVPLLNSIQIEYAYTDKFRFKSDKAAKELGYTIGPLEPAIDDALAWFRANGKLNP